MTIERLTVTAENMGWTLKDKPWAGEKEIGHFFPASMGPRTRMMLQSRVEDDMRSSFLWFRLANGDLILGVFPQAEGYEMVETEVAADYQASLDKVN